MLGSNMMFCSVDWCVQPVILYVGGCLDSEYFLISKDDEINCMSRVLAQQLMMAVKRTVSWKTLSPLNRVQRSVEY